MRATVGLAGSLVFCGRIRSPERLTTGIDARSGEDAGRAAQAVLSGPALPLVGPKPHLDRDGLWGGTFA
jgi:hypothetical protein